MTTKVAAAGRIFHDHVGRRTIGHSTTHANTARQNAITGPGQPFKYGAFTKNPLVLHSNAAVSTNSLAAVNSDACFFSGDSFIDPVVAESRTFVQITARLPAGAHDSVAEFVRIRCFTANH